MTDPDWYAEYCRRRQAAHDLKMLRALPRWLAIGAVLLVAGCVALHYGWVR